MKKWFKDLLLDIWHGFREELRDIREEIRDTLWGEW